MSAQIFIACDVCGEPMAVDEELVKNSLAVSGAMPTARHDTCPGAETTDEVEEAPPRRFRAQISLIELTGERDDVDVQIVAVDGDAEVLAGLGTTVTGRNLAEAVNGPLTTWLNKAWPQLQQSAAFADLPPASDA
jgi:hypothetical protein